jgi:hypothetical protein
MYRECLRCARLYVDVAVIKICTDTQAACEKVACGWAFV